VLLLGPALLAQTGAGASIVLPPRIVAGQPATLAVLNAEGELVPGARVVFRGGAEHTADATGRITFTAPNTPGILLVGLADAPGGASTLVAAPTEDPPDVPDVSRFPRLIPLGETFTMNGSGFRGEADANRVMLGGRPALVLAASPVSLVVLPGPGALPGTSQLVIEAGEHSVGPVPVTLVELSLSADKSSLAPRERGKLTVRVAGTERRLELELRNLSPDRVSLDRGNQHRVITSGGADNTASATMRGLSQGEFTITARVVHEPVGMPDVEAARLQLMAALEQAPPDWRRRTQRVLRMLDRRPVPVTRARDELERMLADYPEGDFGRLIEAAWRTLIGR